RFESDSNSYSLYGGNRHHRRADSSIELSVPRNVRAKSNRQTGADNFADSAECVTGFLRCIYMRDDFFFSARIESAHLRRIGNSIDVSRQLIGKLGDNVAELHDVAADGN